MKKRAKLLNEDGTINVLSLQALLEKPLKVRTLFDPEQKITEVRKAVDTNIQLTRKLELLSPATDSEKAAYKRLYNLEDGDKNTPIHLHMATLYFGETFSAGFVMDIYDQRLIDTMSKKIFKIQELLSGYGLPPFAYIIRSHNARLVGPANPL